MSHRTTFCRLENLYLWPTFLLTLSKHTLFILSTKSLLGKIHKWYPTFLPIFDLPPTLSYDTLPLTAYIVTPFLTYVPLNWTSFMDVHLWTLIFIRISVGFFPKILFWPLKKYSFISFQWSLQNLRTKKYLSIF